MSDLKFTKSHEWISLEDDIATIGITDYAQGQLGDIVFIELPEVQSKVEQSAVIGTIESTKAASEIYASLSGRIVEVNNDLVNNPQRINESAFKDGWMFKIKLTNQSQLSGFMDEVSYKQYIEKEK